MLKKISRLAPSEVSLKTYRCDLWRGVFRGILTTGTQTFALFIAIRHFQGGTTIKSIIGAAPFMGMIASLLLVHYASGTELKKSTLGAIPSLLCGLFLFAAAWADSVIMYTAFIVLAFICLNSLIPFLTSIYGDNYPADQRGAFFSTPTILTVVASAVFGYTASQFLNLNLGFYKIIFTFFGVCALGKAYAIYSMPSKKIEGRPHANPFGNLKYMFQDKSFGYVLAAWFIMGFANLWVLPLRVDYVTSETYGIAGSPVLVAILVTVIPDSMRALFTPLWARLFDQMNFIVLRIILNLTFAVGLVLFFISRETWVIGLGAAFVGIAFGGGSIAWNLWTTHYAPKGKVAAYMSVHVFLTGVRGTIGPVIGFWAAGQFGPATVGWISGGLMLISTFMLIPEIKHGRRNS